ncbi:MAG: radical SAM protein [Bdellovibrionaceae bacterium]|nr:radical SAM protein [Pseudobdellovibrionaceae bacterium]
MKIFFLILFLNFSTLQTGAAELCSNFYLDSPSRGESQIKNSEIKLVRLPRPVDWTTGKIPPFLNGIRHIEIHQSFFERNKFENLTSESLTKLESEIKIALINEADQVNRSVLELELATIAIQNRPEVVTNNGLDRIKKGKALILNILEQLNKDTRFKDLFPAELQVMAQDVLNLYLIVENEITNGSKNRKLKQVNWAISNRCPLCCKGCYFNFRKKEMTMQDVIAVAKKLKQHGVEEIILTGGDPLLAGTPNEVKDVFSEQKNLSGTGSLFYNIVDTLYNFGFKVAIDTTGYTLTENTAKAIAGKVSFVGIPLDGPNQVVVSSFRKGQDDLFEKTISAIDLLKKYNIPVKINTTVTKSNLNHLLELAKLISERGYSEEWGWSVFQWWETRAESKLIEETATPTADYLKAVSQIKKRFPRLKLRAGSVENRALQYFEIMTNGDVLNYSDTKQPGTIILGNVIVDSVQSLVDSPALSTISSKFKTWFHLAGKIEN